MAQHRGVVTVLSERSLRRRYGCRDAASASQGHFIGFGYNSCLTIRSSRTRFVTRLKCVVVPLPQLTDQQVAGRLNSGVRPHKASAKVWRLFALFWLGRFGWFLVRRVGPVVALRGVAVQLRRACASWVRVPTLRRRD